MRVEKEIDPSLKDRQDLIRIMEAAADYLKSHDTDAESQAHAFWKLWAGPNGEQWIGLQLDDQGYSTARQFKPQQLVPADIREMRLIRLWYDVLAARTHREMAQVEKLLSEYGEGD